MITAGIDIGCEWAKVLLLSNEDILSYAIRPCSRESIVRIAQRGLSEAVKKAGIRETDIDYIVATGSYCKAVSFAHQIATEPFCCVRGASLLVPSAVTVIDLGAEKCLVVRCQDRGPIRYARNDRCAAGTGRYIRMASKLLGIEPEETAELSVQSHQNIEIGSTCAVFAESEIISLIHQKRSSSDIMKGVFRSLAHRVYPLLVGVDFLRDVAIFGGLARNAGIVKAIQEEIGCPILVPKEPSIGVAAGAAVVAAEWEKIMGNNYSVETLRE